MQALRGSALVWLLAGSLWAEQTVNLSVNAKAPSEWTIDPLLFGAFCEEHWGDITPGIYEQYLINPSFEKYHTQSREHKPQLVFDINASPGLAFPWEALQLRGSAKYSQAKDCVNSELSQQVELAEESLAGVQQRVTLPDYRVQQFRLRFHAKATGKLSLQALLLDGKNPEQVLDRKDIPGVGEAWAPFEVLIDVKEKLAQRHLQRYGVASVAIVAQGSGRLWLDQATLFPVDCVEGVFNPETLQAFQQVGATMIRWPGGNYTSGYHWRDGVGELLKRPTRPNRSWNGVAANHVGTDEWMRFCKLANLVPVMGVGFGEISATEAAEWVEYCNGSQDTPMGRLRAANGHPQPYGVKHWGVGNEVYGSYQLGHTDAVTYAKGLRQMAAEMKKRDPTIVILASALGVHQAYRDQSKFDDWDAKVIDIAGDMFDLFDVHYYMHGPSSEDTERDGEQATLRAFLSSDRRLAEHCEETKRLFARKPQTQHLKIAMLEWGILPSARRNVPRPRTFTNALCTALHYHELLRRGDLIVQGAFHNFSFYASPVAAHAGPPHPRTAVSQLYAQLAGGKVLKTSVECPRYSLPQPVRDIGLLKDIPEVDCLAVSNERGVYVALVNRSLVQDYPVVLKIDQSGTGLSGQLLLLESDDPQAEQTWSMAPTFKRSHKDVHSKDNTLRVQLPPHALMFLHFKPD